jgi:hypothetical protein
MFCLCFSGNYLSYQLGVAEFLFQTYDLLKEEDQIILAGSSSGSIVSVCLSIGLRPRQMFDEFNIYYKAHHKRFHIDMLTLLHAFICIQFDTLHATDMSKRQCMERLNNMLYVQVSKSIKVGECHHNKWYNIQQVMDDIVHSCRLPGITSPLFSGLKNLDGCFTDVEPKINIQRKWSHVNAKNIFQTFLPSIFMSKKTPEEESAICEDVLLPYIVISSSLWRKRTFLESISGFNIRVGDKYGQILFQQGFDDAVKNRAYFDDKLRKL